MKSSPIVYIEIPAKNTEETISFYKSAFDWKIEPSNLSDKPYWMFQTGENQLAGGFDPSLSASEGGVLIYLKVFNIDETLDQVQKMGGSVVKGKEPVGGEHGFSALVRDPSKNLIGLWSET